MNLTLTPRKRKAAFLVGPTEHIDPSEKWERFTEYKVNGRLLEPGTEFSVRGEGGRRFVFIQAIETPEGAVWVDGLADGPKGPEAWRSFHPDRIKTVHRISKTRSNGKDEG